MKLSEITPEIAAEYLHIEEEPGALLPMLAAAKQYALSFTGLSAQDAEQYEDLTLAVLILCGDLYDHRTMTVENDKVNQTVQTILGLYRSNLL